LADVLLPKLPAVARAPAIPPHAVAAIQAGVANAPAPPPGTGAPGAAANARGLHNVALKIARDHPELLDQPGWRALKRYVAGTQS
jgi:hypothetical protein